MKNKKLWFKICSNFNIDYSVYLPGILAGYPESAGEDFSADYFADRGRFCGIPSFRGMDYLFFVKAL